LVDENVVGTALTTTTINYDNSGRITKLLTTNQAGTVRFQSFAYAYNSDGFVTKLTGEFTNETWDLAYDAQHQLTSALNYSSGTTRDTTKDNIMLHDVIGNMTRKNIGTVTRTYTYNAAGTTRPHAATAATASVNSYTGLLYDAAGFMTSYGAGATTKTLTWDGVGRLTQSVGGTTVASSWDGNDERVKKSVGTTPTITYYPLGDDYEVTGTTTTKYITHGGRLVAKKSGSTKSYIHVDHLGSVNAITSTTPSLVGRNTYNPWGEVISTPIAGESRSWVGLRQDESGQFYMKARFYEPVLGRFLSPDSLIDQGVLGYNRYAYVSNNPMNFVDPTGHDKADGNGGSSTKKPKAIVIYGGTTKQMNRRIARAENYIRNHPGTTFVIIFSGGRNIKNAPGTTEAEYMQKRMGAFSNVVAEKLEQKSQSTAENAYYSAQIIKGMGGGGTFGAVVNVTSQFHAERAAAAMNRALGLQGMSTLSESILRVSAWSPASKQDTTSVKDTLNEVDYLNWVANR
jgi:RHS repeat-associated protein